MTKIVAYLWAHALHNLTDGKDNDKLHGEPVSGSWRLCTYLFRGLLTSQFVVVALRFCS